MESEKINENQQKRKRHVDIENKLMVAKGVEVGGGNKIKICLIRSSLLDITYYHVLYSVTNLLRI